MERVERVGRTYRGPLGVHARAGDAIVPLDSNGDETDRSREVRVIAAEIGRRTGRTVHLVDERFTTAAALRAVKAMGGSTRGRKGDVDALAATVLLQHALNVIK